ncbi:MAG: tetratricopeptide repeat protein [Steroidobacteraceae bacterium]
MGRLFCWQFSVLLLLAAMPAGAQVPDLSQNAQPSDNSPQSSTNSPAAGGTPTAPSILKPGVTITGKPLHSQPPLPKLLPDEFTNCTSYQAGMGESQAAHGGGTGLPDLMTLEACELQMDWEKNVVLGDCIDLNGKTGPRRVIQACTESLDHNVLPLYERSFLFANRAQAYFALGYKQRALEDYDVAVKSAYLLPANERFPLFASRADAYFALGYKQRALDDYNAAIKSAPHDAALYYNRGVVFVAQANYTAALQDFDIALKFDSKFVPALRQRAKIYAVRGDLTGALADYSEAIRLQPKTAALWSDRGELDLGQHEYGGAINDEAHAIQLDPKLASAYYLRSVAFGYSGDREKAVRDLHTAVGLDPSLAAYVTITGKTVVLRLPPL